MTTQNNLPAVSAPNTDDTYERQTIVARVYEGDPLPVGACFLRLISFEDVPHGTGTATRRVYTMLLSKTGAA